MAPFSQAPLAPILFLFLLFPLTYSQSTPLLFSPTNTHCSGGTAQSQTTFYPPALIQCTQQQPTSTGLRCSVPSLPFYNFFFSIYEANVICPSSSSVPDNGMETGNCVLDYELDFALPAVFLLGFGATALCGVLLAGAIYLAVDRVMGGYYESLRELQRKKEKEEEVINALYYMVPSLPEGYGSFGRKVDVTGKWDGSFSSWLEMEEGFAEGEQRGRRWSVGEGMGGRAGRSSMLDSA